MSPSNKRVGSGVTALIQSSGESTLRHIAPGENMQMEVKYGLSAPFSIVDHQPKGITHAQLLRHLASHQQ
jgi:hypothetical protein